MYMTQYRYLQNCWPGAISPVEASIFKPAGRAVNVPPGVPVIVTL